MRSILVIDDNPAVAQALGLLFGLHDICLLYTSLAAGDQIVVSGTDAFNGAQRVILSH